MDSIVSYVKLVKVVCCCVGASCATLETTAVSLASYITGLALQGHLALHLRMSQDWQEKAEDSSSRSRRQPRVASFALVIGRERLAPWFSHC